MYIKALKQNVYIGGTLKEQAMNEEEDIFLEVVGYSPTTKVLGLLLTFRDFDYSITDIEEGAEVGWTTLHEILPRLEKANVIKHTRNVGRAKMYKINLKNPVCKKLQELHDLILNQEFDRLIVKQEKGVKPTEALLSISADEAAAEYSKELPA